MNSNKFRQIVYVLSLLFVFLSFVMTVGCKKNSTSPQVDSLTRPVIWLNTFEMTFSAFKSGGNPEPQVLEVKNTGIDTLNYEMSCDEDWIEVEPSSGNSSGQKRQHEVSVKKAGLSARDDPYEAKILITDTNSYNNPQEVKVSFMITREPPPKIGVSPKNLDFSAQKGGSDPPAQTIEITNTGDGTLQYEIESDAGWLSVSPDSGSSQTKTKKHTVSVSVGSLNVGTHSGTLTIRDPDATNSPQTVEVSLTITKEPPPEIWVNTKTISLEATEGSGISPSAIFKISNSGGGTLDYVIDWDKPWMSVSPSGGTSGGADRKHTLRTDIAGLSEGTYRGTVTIIDSQASNSPQNIDVVLKVKAVAPPLTPNSIGIEIKPGTATTGITVSVSIVIGGNQNEMANGFGTDMSFDPNMFQFLSVSKGNLTGDWAAVAGNETSSGTVRIGGFRGSGAVIAVGSSGTIAVATFRVTGGSYPNGQQSQVSISNYQDDIAGMKPDPARATFTLQK